MDLQLRTSEFLPRSLAERRAWALRQGNPLWLWPEIAVRDWQDALLEIERACEAMLAGKGEHSVWCGPAALGLAGYTSGMGPLLGHWFEHGRIALSNDAAAVVRHQLAANTARMRLLLSRAGDAVGELTARGVEVTLLKGVHTASAHFPDVGCRPMSDIDILVSPADADAAALVLQALGYRRTGCTSLESTWRHSSAAAEPQTMISLEADDPWAIDLHVSHDIPGPPGAAPASLSRIQGRTEPSLAIARARQLAHPVLLLHLAAHAGSGFHNLTLLRLFEIVLVARDGRASGSLSWDEFAELGAATGSLAFAYPALAMARQLAPDAIPQAIVEVGARSAPARIRQVVDRLRPATIHRIDQPTVREHFAWTHGPGGWLRRLAADLLPNPASLRQSAAIYGSRARALWRQGITRPQP